MSENTWEVAESFVDFVEQLKSDEEMENRGPFDYLEWKGTVTLQDGRKFIADASFLIDLQYIEILREPKKLLPLQKVQRLLEIDTTACFQLEELRQQDPGGHYQTPNGILLNKKYIQLLQHLTPQDDLYLRTSTPQATVILCDGQKIMGALMPLKAGSD